MESSYNKQAILVFILPVSSKSRFGGENLYPAGSVDFYSFF